MKDSTLPTLLDQNPSRPASNPAPSETSTNSQKPPPKPPQNTQMKALLFNFNEQRKRKQFTDITIIVESTPFHLHRCLLAANSEYFHKLFTAAVPANTVYVLLNITSNAFQVIVDFIYTGGFTLNKQNVNDVFIAAKTLHITHVIKCCEKVMESIDSSGLDTSPTPTLPTMTLTKPLENTIPDFFKNPAIANLLAAMKPNPLAESLSTMINSQIKKSEERNMLSLQNSLLPIEVQQVFLKQLSAGKLNSNVSREVREDAAKLAKELEKKVKVKKREDADIENGEFLKKVSREDEIKKAQALVEKLLKCKSDEVKDELVIDDDDDDKENDDCRKRKSNSGDDLPEKVLKI